MVNIVETFYVSMALTHYVPGLGSYYTNSVGKVAISMQDCQEAFRGAKQAECECIFVDSMTCWCESDYLAIVSSHLAVIGCHWGGVGEPRETEREARKEVEREHLNS